MSQTYRLLSTPLLHAPGMVRFLRELYRTDPTKAAEILAEGWSLGSDVARGILDGTILTTADADGALVFTLP